MAAIAPFNFPLNLIAHKLAPAVAVGASVVLKPPPQCPLTAFVLAEIMEEAGLPAGALSVIPCDPDVAQRMVEDDRMKVLSFTGSDTVGWRLKALAGDAGAGRVGSGIFPPSLPVTKLVKLSAGRDGDGRTRIDRSFEGQAE